MVQSVEKCLTAYCFVRTDLLLCCFALSVLLCLFGIEACKSVAHSVILVGSVSGFG